MAKLNWKSPASFAVTPLSVAHNYIRQGVPVFPCRAQNEEGVDLATGEIVDWPEKSPYTSNGLKGASRSTRIVDILFGERHPTAAIGVPTGSSLGAWVLDLDRHGDRDGHTWLADMEDLHGKLPPTARASTANGGTHIFFRHVDGVRNRGAIAPGVDTRGEGGYVLAPGSVMVDGRRYAWIDHDGDDLPEFADAPEWLLDLVVAKAPPPVTAERSDYVYSPGGSHEIYVERAIEAETAILARALVGGRGTQVNKSAFSLGTLVGAGALDRSTAESELFSAAVACGVVKEDGEREIRLKIKRGLEAGMKQPRQLPEPSANDNTTPVDPESVRRIIETDRKKKAARVDADRLDPAGAAIDEPISSEAIDEPISSAATLQPASQPKRNKERFELTWFDEIEEGKPKETILKGALGAGEFTTISGLPGTGKSVIVTDMACHIAAGMEWHGRKVKQGLVIYVAAERKKLTERRMMAFRKEHGVQNVPLLVIGGRLDFTRDLRDAKELIKVVREAETITGQKCVWVIIDTLTRVFGAGDQNASKDMSRFVQSCDEVLAELQCHVTAIHHSAWTGERGKGAIDLDGAVDASFMVKKNGGSYKLVCDGTNDGEEGDILSFTMKSVDLGLDEDGEPTTAPVVVKATDAKLKTSAEVTAGKNARALELLVELVNRDGVDPESPGYPAGAMVVSPEAWRAAVYEDAGTSIAQEALKKRFARAKKDLLAEGLIGENPTWVWVIPRPQAEAV